MAFWCPGTQAPLSIEQINKNINLHAFSVPQLLHLKKTCCVCLLPKRGMFADNWQHMPKTGMFALNWQHHTNYKRCAAVCLSSTERRE